jgi:hypothetical protein
LFLNPVENLYQGPKQQADFKKKANRANGTDKDEQQYGFH